MYKLIATTSTGLDTTNEEVLGEYLSMVFDDEGEATDAAQEAQEEAREGVVVSVEPFDCDLPDLDLPEGMEAEISVAGNMVVVELVVRQGADIDDDAWQAAEDAIDLPGLAFRDGAPLGGPFHRNGVTYSGGTYQRWVRA